MDEDHRLLPAAFASTTAWTSCSVQASPRGWGRRSSSFSRSHGCWSAVGAYTATPAPRAGVHATTLASGRKQGSHTMEPWSRASSEAAARSAAALATARPRKAGTAGTCVWRARLSCGPRVAPAFCDRRASQRRVAFRGARVPSRLVRRPVDRTCLCNKGPGHSRDPIWPRAVWRDRLPIPGRRLPRRRGQHAAAPRAAVLPLVVVRGSRARSSSLVPSLGHLPVRVRSGTAILPKPQRR